MSAAADDLFRWEDLDLRLISPKINELAEEMKRRSAEAEGAIGFKTAQSSNSAGYLPRLFDFHEKLVDEWAERLYAAHCETWSQQNRTISPEFIRAVRDRPVAQLIAARKSSLQAQVCLRGMRIGEQPKPTAWEEWDRRMDRLATRWNSKLEADAVAYEYRVSKNRQISNSPRADSAQEAAADLPDLLNEPAGTQSPGDRPDRIVKTEKLPTTAEAVSKQLLAEVNSLFKKFRMRRFENVEDLAEADEWQGLNRLFRSVGERYAKASRRAEDRRVWSRKKIESDRQAIHQQHAQHFCLLQSRRSDLGIDNALRVFETKLDFAMSEGMCEAAVCIDGSELLNCDRQNNDPTRWKSNTHRSRRMNLEKLTFRKLKRGETIAEKPFTDSALLNTYESFSKTLAEIRAFIKARAQDVKARARDVTALHEKLKDNFGRTDLGRAATDENWVTWVDDFLKENATAGNVALVFLEEKTGLKRGTLKVRFSAARNKRKMRN
jgi:hypothetical protein